MAMATSSAAAAEGMLLTTMTLASWQQKRRKRKLVKEGMKEKAMAGKGEKARKAYRKKRVAEA